MTQNPGSITFTRPGTYQVRVSVMNMQGQRSAPVVRQVVVNPSSGAISPQAPNTTITAPLNDVTIGLGESVVFEGIVTDADNNFPVLMRWRFDGAAPSVSSLFNSTSGANPGAVTFNQTGTFTVTLGASDSTGATDATPATVTVTVVPTAQSPVSNNLPVATINSPNADLVVNVGSTVDFQGTGVDPGGDTNLSYFWSFSGAAPNQTVQNPGLVTFNRAGTIQVRLTVTNSRGISSNAAVRTITVQSPTTGSTAAPTARIDSPTTSVTNIRVGETVHFMGNAVSTVPNASFNYLWTFGNNSIPNSTLQSPGDVQFNTRGTYLVRLVVTDNLGVQSTPVSRTVVVQ